MAGPTVAQPLENLSRLEGNVSQLKCQSSQAGGRVWHDAGFRVKKRIGVGH